MVKCVCKLQLRNLQINNAVMDPGTCYLPTLPFLACQLCPLANSLMVRRLLTAALNEMLLSSHPLEDREISPSRNTISSLWSHFANLGHVPISKLIIVHWKTALNESQNNHGAWDKKF